MTRRTLEVTLKKKNIGSEARAEHMAKVDTDQQLRSRTEQGQLQKWEKRQLPDREDVHRHLSYYILIPICYQFED